MRAAVVYEHGPIGNIVLEDRYPDPRPDPGWVVLRVKACSLNHHDIFTRRGMPGIKTPLPLIIGSDVAGEIVELGAGVEGWSVGERVLVDPYPVEAVGYRFFGESMDGGRAELCRAHASQLLRIPDGVSDEVAASIPLAYATAHRMLLTVGGLEAGERILVLGASGGVGTAAVKLAKLVGAEVVACASSDEKLERLAGMGADHLVNYSKETPSEAVRRLFGKPRAAGGGGVNVVVNSTGGGTWIDSLKCLALRGRLLTCGATAGFRDEVDVRYVWTFEHRLLGSNGWTRADIQALLDHAASRALVPEIDRVLPLERIHEAEELLEARQVIGKVVVRPDLGVTP